MMETGPEAKKRLIMEAATRGDFGWIGQVMAWKSQIPMQKRYKTILADPPWPERGGGRIKRGADRHYPLMTVGEIVAMGSWVKDISEDDAHLYLWVTNNYLRAGLEVMEAWGFRYITKVTWLKDMIGLGQYFRGSTEDCLFGVRGHLPYKEFEGKRVQGITFLYERRRAHSQKPEGMGKMIEKVSYEPRIELFARERRDGWDAWGDEV